MFDSTNGGMRRAPKFPHPAILEMLWRAGLRTTDARFFETVEHTLERMSEGGIYDHLGGGFRDIPSTKNGWCRISRRCSTTTPNFSNCWRSRGSTAVYRYLPSAPTKPWRG